MSGVRGRVIHLLSSYSSKRPRDRRALRLKYAQTLVLSLVSCSRISNSSFCTAFRFSVLVAERSEDLVRRDLIPDTEFEAAHRVYEMASRPWTRPAAHQSSGVSTTG